jgi:hypothetical protein
MTAENEEKIMSNGMVFSVKKLNNAEVCELFL